MHQIDNFIFTYRNKCNMNCNFCFIPFIDETAGNIKVWREIIDYLLKFSPKLITFGGGDPFKEEDFLELVKYTKEKRMLVQVDTNGIAIKDNMYKDIANNIDLLGLPLDGVGTIHDEFRHFKGHYDIVLKHLKGLSQYNCKIKINTVITSYNYKSLIELAEELNKFNLSCWSLHEFWYYANINHRYYKLDSELVMDTVDKIKEASKNKVQFISPSEVKNEHVFVSSIGEIYITDSSSENKYFEIGNFRDSGIDKDLEKYLDCVAISKRYNRKLYEEE